jgi:MoaA/NifB/PqqE/SkfB family radical SAM enzyme
MDVKITNQCDMQCPMCHEDSTIEGEHGELLNVEFINSLNPYTELALGGGNPLSHPNLVEFLQLCRDKRIIVNMTVNQVHFMKSQEYINLLLNRRLIVGLGVSLVSVTEEFVETLKQYPNAVIHIINGITPIKDLERLYDNNFKILILGYKQFRRGISNYESNSIQIEEIKSEIYDYLDDMTKHFKVVSFDNLAIKQLEVERLMSKEQWNEFYMGDDGKFTMYVDLVKKEFARSSISEKRYSLLENIEDMFKIILNEK